MNPTKPTQPLAPLAPLAPIQPVKPSGPTQPTLGIPSVGSTYDSVYDSYEKAAAPNQTLNTEEKANDIFDPFFNKDVRAKYTDTWSPTIAAMSELVVNQFKAYEDGVFNGIFTNLGLVGESLDKITGLPVRTLIHSMQTRGDFWQMWGEGFTTNHSVSAQNIREHAGLDFGSNWGNFLGDMAAEVLLDPTIWIGVGAMTKAGRASDMVQTLAKGVGTLNAGAGKLMKATPIGIAGEAYKLGGKQLSTLNAHLQTGAVPNTLADDVANVRAAREATTPTSILSDDAHQVGVETSLNKIQETLATKRADVPVEVQMDSLAKHQTQLDELFIQATTKRVDDVFDKAVYHNYDALEFFDLINTDLKLKNPQHLEDLDKVIKAFEDYMTHADRQVLPMVNSTAENIYAQLYRARTQLQDTNILTKLLEVEGEFDLMYTLDFFIEKMKERGPGGRWDEEMIYAWTHSVEPSMKLLRQNKQLLDRYPELAEIQDFFKWLENPTKPLNEQALGVAIDRANDILDNLNLTPMNTRGFDFLFDRVHNGTIPEPVMVRTQKGSTDFTPEDQILNRSVKVDRQIETALAPYKDKVNTQAFKEALELKYLQMDNMDYAELSRYTDDTIMIDKLQDSIEYMIESVNDGMSVMDIIDLYQDYQSDVVDFVEMLRDSQRLEKGAFDSKLESFLRLTKEIEEPMQELMTAYQKEVGKYDRTHAHIQLNKQRTQAELIHEIRANEVTNDLFKRFEDQTDPMFDTLSAVSDQLPSVKALMTSMKDIQQFEKFTNTFNTLLLKAGNDYNVDNQILDSLYNYLDQVKKIDVKQPKLLKKIQAKEINLEALHQRANRLESNYLKTHIIPAKERELALLKHGIIEKRDVKLPDLLKPYNDVIDDYLSKVTEVAKVPDGMFSSQLKHVSDDLKNQFPLLKDLMESRLNVTAEDYAEQLAQVRQMQGRMSYFQTEATQLMNEAKNEIRIMLKRYKDENRKYRHHYISNEDAYDFARNFQLGYKNIAEYLKNENPRLMIKNGDILNQEVALKTWAKKLYPDEAGKRQLLVQRLENHIQEAGADKAVTIGIFLDSMNNPVHTVPKVDTVQKEVYQKLFPANTYTGDQYDKLMKDAIVRTKLVTEPDTYTRVVADKLMPTSYKQTDDYHYVDHLREVYNTFRDREYVEALQYVSQQATEDAWRWLSSNQKVVQEQYQDLFNSVKPMSRDELLKGVYDNPLFQMKTQLGSWEEAKPVFKNNPQLTAVAVIEANNPQGYQVIPIQVHNQASYNRAAKLDAMLLDYESAQHLQSLFKDNPFREQPLLRFWQKWFVQSYKVQALINVGFHVTNFFDLLVKNASHGTMAEVPKNVWNTLRGQYDIIRYESQLKALPFEQLSKADQKLVSEVRDLKKTLVMGTELTAEQIRDNVSRPDQIRNKILYDNLISKTNQTIGNTLEDGGRLALYRQLRESQSASEAMYNLLHTHFDYSNKSTAMQWAELVFPFTTFAVRNSLFWSAQIVENPKLVEYLYEAMLYNYSENGYDLEDPETYIGHTVGYNARKGNLIVPANTESGSMYLNNGNSLMDAMSFVAQPLQSMSNRLHPIIKETMNDWTGEAAQWDKTLPFYNQGQLAQKVAGGTEEKPNDLGLYNLIGSTFYEPKTWTNWNSQYTDKSKYPDYPDYPKGQKYYPRYYGSRSYNRYRSTHSYNFYKSLYTSTGKSRLALRLTPTNYRNLESRINDMKY